MDGDRKVDVPDLEPTRKNFRNGTRVGEEQDGLVIGYHLLHHPQSRSHFGMGEQFSRESMILISRLRRTNRCGKPHDLKFSLGNPAQPLQCNSKLASPLVLGQLVDLIYDQEPCIPEMPPQDAARQYCLERLGRGDEQIRRAPRLARPLPDLSISMPHRHPEVYLLAPPSQTVEKVPVEGSEWGDVDDLDPGVPVRLAEESCEDGEYRGLCLAARRWRDQQHIFPLQNGRNRLLLRLRRSQESSFLDSLR